MAGTLVGREADIVAGLDRVALVAEPQRRFTFEANDVLFLEQMIMEGNRLLAGRQLLIGNADLAPVLAGVRQNAKTHEESGAMAGLAPGHVLDRDGPADSFLLAHADISSGSRTHPCLPCSMREGQESSVSSLRSGTRRTALR